MLWSSWYELDCMRELVQPGTELKPNKYIKVVPVYVKMDVSIYEITTFNIALPITMRIGIYFHEGVSVCL